MTVIEGWAKVYEISFAWLVSILLTWLLLCGFVICEIDKLIAWLYCWPWLRWGCTWSLSAFSLYDWLLYKWVFNANTWFGVDRTCIQRPLLLLLNPTPLVVDWIEPARAWSWKLTVPGDCYNESSSMRLLILVYSSITDIAYCLEFGPGRGMLGGRNGSKVEPTVGYS